MGRWILGFLALMAVSGVVVGAPLTVVGFNVESGDASDHVISLQLEKSVGVDLWGLVDVWNESGWPERLQKGAAAGEGVAFGTVLGQTGGDSRLQVLYREDRLDSLGTDEIVAAQVSEREPAPLAVRFRLDGGEDFWFLVVDLSDTGRRRLVQARALADWAGRQSLPIVAAGTFRFGVEPGRDEDPAMELLLASGWRWAKPAQSIGTSCADDDRVEDFVFLAGSGTSWGDRSEVMYPQSNYCPDDGRTSNHRPVLVNLEPAGGIPAITGSMPERQVRPFFPEEMESSAEAEPALANRPVTAGVSGAADPRSSQVAPAAPAGAAVTRDALLRRLEALEAEAARLRREIEASKD
jgi:hypothetical protein